MEFIQIHSNSLSYIIWRRSIVLIYYVMYLNLNGDDLVVLLGTGMIALRTPSNLPLSIQRSALQTASKRSGQPPKNRLFSRKFLAARPSSLTPIPSLGSQDSPDCRPKRLLFVRWNRLSGRPSGASPAAAAPSHRAPSSSEQHRAPSTSAERRMGGPEKQSPDVTGKRIPEEL